MKRSDKLEAEREAKRVSQAQWKLRYTDARWAESRGFPSCDHPRDQIAMIGLVMRIYQCKKCMLKVVSVV